MGDFREGFDVFAPWAEPRSVVRHIARLGACVAMIAAMAGCSSRDDSPDTKGITIVPSRTVVAPPATPAPVPRVTPTPVAAPTVAPLPTRNFADPPLPRELQDDGGLTPLPPRPPPSAMANTMRPTFERP